MKIGDCDSEGASMSRSSSSIPFRQAAYLQPLKDFSVKDKAEPRGPGVS